MNHRFAIVATLLVLSSVGFDAHSAGAGGYFGEPVIMSPGDWEKFSAGARQFARVWDETDGVQPTFNERSCMACHAIPMAGGAGLTKDTFVLVSPDATDQLGGHVVHRLQRESGTAVARQVLIPSARRKTPPLFGLGLVEYVPVEELMKPRPGPDGIRGRLGGTPDQPGRLGWKASIPDLQRFVRAAFAIELGFGSGVVKVANRPALETAIDEVTAFVRMLGPPPTRNNGLPVEQAGSELFARIGCAQCHVPQLTGRYQRENISMEFHIAPYSDFLLHDMGPGLSDGISEGAAGASDFRTAPLWGLTSFGPPYLHDGRALDITQAIAAHGGEAKPTRVRWESLKEEERKALLTFLRTL